MTDIMIDTSIVIALSAEVYAFNESNVHDLDAAIRKLVAETVIQEIMTQMYEFDPFKSIYTQMGERLDMWQTELDKN